MIRLLFVVSFLFLAPGCVQHRPTQVELPVVLPAEYRAHQVHNAAEAAPGKWWLAFQDEKLNHLMGVLFAKNLELTQAYARLEQVESILQSTRSAQAPQLNIGGEAKRSRQPGLNKDFTGDSQQLSVAAGYEADLWGKLASRSQAAELDYLATQLDTQTLYLSLSARLADLHFATIEQRAQLELTEKAITSFAETAARVNSRYRRGLAPAVEMYQAQQSLSAASAARYLYEARLAEAEHAMAVLLGSYPESDDANTTATLPNAPELIATGVPAELVARRPDLQAGLKRIAAADARVAAAIAERFPSISLAGGLGTIRQEVTAGLLRGEFWSLLGNLALPVLDGGRRRAEVDRKEAQLAEAVAAYQLKVLVAFREVEDALANNYAISQRVEHLTETAQSTAATLRLSTDRYLAGLTDYLPVLTSQRADFEAQRQLLAARRQMLADRISLARALGGRWMREMMDEKMMVEKDVSE